MMGELGGDEEEAGLIPRAISHIFSAIEREVEEGGGAGLAVTYAVSLSFLEIYNEKAGDLLVPGGGDLEIREQDGMFFAPLLTRVEVRSREELVEWVSAGNERKNVAATVQNSRSSRSHTILTLYIEKRVGKKEEEARQGGEGEGPAPDASLFISSKLNLVDLAGSERLSTSTKHKQGRETLSINLSLSCLSNCILCLTEGSIPTYRDSKLTRLLKDSLGGNSKTTMIACINTLEGSASESVSTLRWAERAKRVKNQPVLNDGDRKDARLRALRDEVEAMKMRMVGRNKDLIRMLYMVKQLGSSRGRVGVGGQEEEKRADEEEGSVQGGSGDVDLDLTEAILQDPFNHPLAAMVARSHEDEEGSSPFPLPTAEKAGYEEKVAEGSDASPATTPPIFLSRGPELLAAPVPLPPAPRGSVSMHRDVFRIFKQTMMTVNEQIKAEVQKVPAFVPSPPGQGRGLGEEGVGGVGEVGGGVRGGGGGRGSKVVVRDFDGELEAMREAMEEAERERMAEAEGRAYLEGLLADVQRQLQEAVEGKMDVLMRCRCKELEGKAEELAMRVEEEVRVRQRVEEEKQQLWLAVEEGEKERAEERKALDTLRPEVERLRARDRDREKEREEVEVTCAQEAEMRRHESAEAAVKLEQVMEGLMHVEAEKRRSEEERAALEEQLQAMKAQLTEVRSTVQTERRAEGEEAKRVVVAKEEQLRAEVDDWQRRAETAEAAVDAERRQRGEAEQLLRTLREELLQQQTTVTAAEGGMRAVTEELASLRSYIAAQTVARETENRALKAAAKEKAQTAEEAEVRAEEAMARLEKMRETLQGREEDLKQLEEEVKEARRARTGLEQLRRSFQSTSASLDSANDGVGQPSVVEAAGRTMTKLSETLSHAEVRAMMVGGLPEASPVRKEEEAQSLDDLVAAVTRMHEVGAAQRVALQCEVEEQMRKVSGLQSEMALHASRVQSLQEAHDTSMQANSVELERLREEQRQTTDGVEEWKVELERLEDARRREVDLITNDLHQRDASIVALRSTLQTVEREKGEEVERREELETDVKVMTEELGRSRERVEALQRRVDGLELEVSQRVGASPHHEEEAAEAQLSLLAQLEDARAEVSRLDFMLCEVAQQTQLTDEERLREEEEKVMAESQMQELRLVLTERSVELQRSTSVHSSRVEQLTAEVQRLSSERQQLSDEQDAIHLQLARLMHDHLEMSATVQTCKEAETGWREKAQTLAQLLMESEEATTELRLSLQRSDGSLITQRTDHTQAVADLTHLRSLLSSKDSQLALYEQRLHSLRERSAREEVVEKALETVREELKQERRKVVALQEALNRAALGASQRRRAQRTVSWPVLPSTSPTLEVGMEVVERVQGEAAGDLYEVATELRVVCGELKDGFEEVVQSKRALATATATEVEAMRDELREWQREEWERVKAVDRVKRRIHPAPPTHKRDRSSGCVLM